MKKSDFLDSVAHGDAWRYFCKEMAGKLYSLENQQNAWNWFLDGWLAKAKQQDTLRNRR